MKIEPKGAAAARLRQRKFELVRRFHLPSDPVGGSLSEIRRRCGKSTCHCADGEGHPLWLLTFMVDGKKRVERVPKDWAEQVGHLVKAGRDLKDAVGEVLSINARLLALWRRQAGR